MITIRIPFDNLNELLNQQIYSVLQLRQDYELSFILECTGSKVFSIINMPNLTVVSAPNQLIIIGSKDL